MAFERHSDTGALLTYAPLYAGPFLAGLSLAPWAVTLVFAAIFAALILKTRPLPETLAELAIAAAAVFAVNLLIAGGVIGLGKLLAQLAGPLPLPLWGGILLSATAAIFAIWRAPDPETLREMEGVLDAATRALEGKPLPADWDLLEPAEQGIDPSNQAAIDHTLCRLRALPDTYSVGHVDTIVQDLESATGQHGLHGLLAAAGQGEERVDFALLRYVASPYVRRKLDESADLADVSGFGLGSRFAKIREQAAHLLWAMLDDSCRSENFPRDSALEDAAIADPDTFREVGDAVIAYRKRMTRGLSL